ncbi:hypothetical protein SAMN02745883_00254 [Caminicella sporogenes DSM 14501]|uniref:CNNM transmembrane domain-containing protein n=1 Tax=Caminicella sporogenes DSM 14501 TaxID=1121266 RepID=A0A1M6LLA1_9FIRM|nr:hypothetical protein [Caminicella sporogenes]SHJ72006.1 hypothetical protein SAMN02745883_00254 [Caminicella sporogenes DSM 14501]
MNKTKRKKINRIKIAIKSIKNYNFKWIINVTIITFILAIGMSIISEALLRNASIGIAFLVLIIIIFIGIVFDLIGIAVATADQRPFNAMASKRIKGAKEAIRLIQNAGPVSNFCNDVIGDIAGIISGAAGAIILIQISKIYKNIDTAIFSIILSAVVAALTVGGKAFGKEIALRKSKEIVFFVAKLLNWLSYKFKIGILPNNKKKKVNKKKGK